MVEIDEEDRVEFGSLKIQMPDYEEIREFFTKMNNGELDEADYNQSVFSDEGNNYNF